MEQVRRAREALRAVRDVIQAHEERLAELKAEITRKALWVQRMTEPDLEDVPPAQRLIVPADVIDISDPEATCLEWCGTSGLKLTLITGLEHLKKLERVNFRSGFIRKPSGLDHCHDTMTVLELYENRLRTLQGVEKLTKLVTLDVSYNRLGRIEGELLRPLTGLTRLYLAENKLSEIDLTAFQPLVNLEVLDLGGNNLRKIQGLESLGNLKELWLGKNKITKIEGLEGLKSLRKLSIQSNRIVKMENLEHFTNLEELYLSDQGITAIEGIDQLQTLTTLDLTQNRLRTVDGLPRLPLLTDLWLAANQIESIQEVDKIAALLSDKMDTLVLERNPVWTTPGYRDYVKSKLPSLAYIDADRC